MRAIKLFMVIVLLAGCVQTRSYDAHSTVLAGGEAARVVKQCSRAVPPGISGYWIITSALQRRLDSAISNVPGLVSGGCCQKGERIPGVGAYVFQYVGVVVKGQKLIYINALIPDEFAVNWRVEAIVACDGGDSYWGGVYNPQTGRFTDLAINGNG